MRVLFGSTMIGCFQTIKWLSFDFTRTQNANLFNTNETRKPIASPMQWQQQRRRTLAIINLAAVIFCSLSKMINIYWGGYFQFRTFRSNYILMYFHQQPSVMTFPFEHGVQFNVRPRLCVRYCPFFVFSKSAFVYFVQPLPLRLFEPFGPNE